MSNQPGKYVCRTKIESVEYKLHGEMLYTISHPNLGYEAKMYCWRDAARMTTEFQCGNLQVGFEDRWMHGKEGDIKMQWFLDRYLIPILLNPP